MRFLRKYGYEKISKKINIYADKVIVQSKEWLKNIEKPDGSWKKSHVEFKDLGEFQYAK